MRLVLQLLVGHAHQRFQRHLVVQRLGLRHLHHLGGDEALDQAEDVGIAAALHLAEQALVGRAQEAQLVDQRQAGGQEDLGVVEGAAADDIALDLPTHALGDFDDLGIALGVDGCRT